MKVPLDYEQLRALGVIALRNKTEAAFVALALDWAEAADAEIARLQGVIEAEAHKP